MSSRFIATTIAAGATLLGGCQLPSAEADSEGQGLGDLNGPGVRAVMDPPQVADLKGEDLTAQLTADKEGVLQQMREFKARGYEPVAVLGFLQDENQSVTLDGLFHDVPLDTLRRYRGTGASEFLRWHHIEAHHIPGELTPEGISQVRIPPYRVEVERPSDNQAVIKVFDYLTDPTTPIFQRTISGVSRSGYIRPTNEEARAIGRELFELMRDRMEEPQQVLDSAPPAETFLTQSRTVTLALNNQIPPTTQQDMGELFANYREMRVEVMPSGAERDNLYAAGEIAGVAMWRSIGFTLKDEVLDRLDGNSIQIDGQVLEVTLERSIPVQSLDTDDKPITEATINGLPVVERLSTENGMPLWITRVPRSYDSKWATEKATLYIPTPFENPTNQDTQVNDSGLVSLPLDFRPAGGPLLEGVLEVAPVPYIGEHSGLQLYTNMDVEQIREEVTPYLPAITESVLREEERFGFETGDLAKRVYFVNGKHANAYFYLVDPDTVVFQDEILRPVTVDDSTEASVDLGLVASHETLHLIDGSTDYQLSAGALEQFFNTHVVQSPGFFEAINESNFLPGMPAGGHSDSNQRELFASIVNGFNHPNWESAVRNLSDEYQSLYQKALEAIRTNLDNCPSISAQAPIRADLKRRIDFLAKK